MKKIVLSSILVLLLIFITACQTQPTVSQPTGETPPAETPAAGTPNGGTAIYSIHSDAIIFWDPSDSFSNEIIALQNIYETLLRYDVKTNAFEKVLAEDYSKSEDGLTWTFKLREGVKFHTGATLSAELVKKSIERTIARGKGSSFIWESVDAINVIDEYTVEFKLKFAESLENVVSAGYSAYIFDADAIEANGEDWLNKGNDAGSGPYTVQEWTQGSTLVLKYFPDYWKGWKTNHFTNVVYKTTPEPNTRQLQLEAGEADITNNLLVEQLDSLKNNPKIVVDQTNEFNNLTVQFNTQKAPLNNPKVRKALAYAIPYGDIVNNIKQGAAEQSTGYLPTGLWGHDTSLLKYTYDLDKAKALLKEANVTGGNLTVTYVTGDETERQIAEVLKAEFLKIGFNLEIKGMPWDAQWDLSKATDANDRQDLFLIYYWSGYSDPYGFLSIPYKSEDPIVYNLGYYDSERFDSLIKEARETAGSDRGKAIALYKEAQELLIEDVPGISIFDLKGTFAYKSDFKGYVSNPYYANVVFFYDTYRE